MIKLNHHVAVACLVAGLVLQTTAVDLPGPNGAKPPAGCSGCRQAGQSRLERRGGLGPHQEHRGLLQPVGRSNHLSPRARRVSKRNQGFAWSGQPGRSRKPRSGASPSPVRRPARPNASVPSPASSACDATYAPAPVAPAAPMPPAVPMAQPASLDSFRRSSLPTGLGWMCLAMAFAGGRR